MFVLIMRKCELNCYNALDFYKPVFLVMRCHLTNLAIIVINARRYSDSVIFYDKIISYNEIVYPYWITKHDTKGRFQTLSVSFSWFSQMWFTQVTSAETVAFYWGVIPYKRLGVYYEGDEWSGAARIYPSLIQDGVLCGNEWI